MQFRQVKKAPASSSSSEYHLNSCGIKVLPVPTSKLRAGNPNPGLSGLGKAPVEPKALEHGQHQPAGIDQGCCHIFQRPRGCKGDSAPQAQTLLTEPSRMLPRAQRGIRASREGRDRADNIPQSHLQTKNNLSPRRGRSPRGCQQQWGRARGGRARPQPH